MAANQNTLIPIQYVAVLMARQSAAQDTEMMFYWYPAICFEHITAEKSWEQIGIDARDAYERHLSPRAFARWVNAVRASGKVYESNPSSETLASVRALLKPHFDHYARMLMAKWGDFDPATHEWTDEEMEFCSPAPQKTENLQCFQDWKDHELPSILQAAISELDPGPYIQ